MRGLRRKARSSVEVSKLPAARSAKRKLANFQREIGCTLPGANLITVAQLADMHLATQQHLEKSTREDKGRIVRRIKDS